MRNNRKSFYVILVSCLVNAGVLMNLETYVQIAEARPEQILDNTNNNLKISMDVPDSWNSGTVSETISKLNWRLNGLECSK